MCRSLPILTFLFQPTALTLGYSLRYSNLMISLKRRAGFTLIELLVVIAVLGILAAGIFVAINPLKRIGQANDVRVKSDIGQIAQASQAYYTQKLSYPKTVAQLVANGDLKTEPKQPETDGPYTIEVKPDETSCDGTAGNPCTEITIQALLASPQTPSATYQWNSTTNIAGEIGPTPTVTPTPGPPTPTPLPPFVVSDDNQTDFWSASGDGNPGGQPIWTITGLANPSISGTYGANSLQIIIGSGSLTHPYLAHDYGSNRANWSGYNKISFNWLGANTGAVLSFMIQTGPDGSPWDNASYCNFTDDSTVWKTVTIPFSSCDTVGGGANLGTIRRIFLGSNVGLPNGTPSPFTLYVDRVVVSQ